MLAMANFTAAWGPLLKAVAVAMLLMMGTAIEATANHYILNLVLGTVVAPVGLALAGLGPTTAGASYGWSLLPRGRSHKTARAAS